MILEVFSNLDDSVQVPRLGLTAGLWCSPRQYPKSCYGSLLGAWLELFGFWWGPELHERRSVCPPTSGLPCSCGCCSSCVTLLVHGIYVQYGHYVIPVVAWFECQTASCSSAEMYTGRQKGGDIPFAYYFLGCWRKCCLLINSTVLCHISQLPCIYFHDDFLESHPRLQHTLTS